MYGIQKDTASEHGGSILVAKGAVTADRVIVYEFVSFLFCFLNYVSY